MIGAVPVLPQNSHYSGSPCITYLPPPMLPCQKWVDGLFLLVQRAVCKDDAINVCERAEARACSATLDVLSCELMVTANVYVFWVVKSLARFEICHS